MDECLPFKEKVLVQVQVLSKERSILDLKINQNIINNIRAGDPIGNGDSL